MKWYYWLIIAAALLLIFMERGTIYNILGSLLKKFEGFSAVPYWDNKQWSWGYGSRVPGSIDSSTNNPGGSITQSDAIKEAINISSNNKAYIEKYLTRDLTPNQWAALLSFTYNEGQGAVKKLLDEVNSESPSLEAHMKQYVYAGGVINNDLVERRNEEWDLYNS